jgi:hypothetical protein
MMAYNKGEIVFACLRYQYLPAVGLWIEDRTRYFQNEKQRAKHSATYSVKQI